MESNHVLTRLVVSAGARRRAETEPFAFELTQEGVGVTNHRYENPENHRYIVTVADGVPTACECPADSHYEPACKHRLAVAIRTPVLNAAATQALADGGTRTHPEELDAPIHDPPSEDAETDPEWCDCADLDEGFPCFECVVRNLKRLPAE